MFLCCVLNKHLHLTTSFPITYTTYCGINPLSHTHSSKELIRKGAVLLPGHSYMRLSPGQKWLRGHSWQRPEGALQKPGRHTQSDANLEPGSEAEWSLHFVALPCSGMPPQKKLAAQSPHGPPGGPEYLAIQRQSVCTVLTAVDRVPELAGHVVHSWLPVASLYVPAGHAPHVLVPVLVYPAMQMQSLDLTLLTGDVENE